MNACVVYEFSAPYPATWSLALCLSFSVFFLIASFVCERQGERETLPSKKMERFIIKFISRLFAVVRSFSLIRSTATSLRFSCREWVREGQRQRHTRVECARFVCASVCRNFKWSEWKIGSNEQFGSKKLLFHFLLPCRRKDTNTHTSAHARNKQISKHFKQANTHLSTHQNTKKYLTKTCYCRNRLACIMLSRLYNRVHVACE